MIYPPPWNLSGQDRGKGEENLPKAAIDSKSYPPFRLVWSLEVFDRYEDELLEETVLENFDVAAFRKAMRRPPSDPMVGGSWRVSGRQIQTVQKLVGRKLKLGSRSYFITGWALNLAEVKSK